MALFKRLRKTGTDTSELGAQLIALRLEAGDIAPPNSMVVVFDGAGQARRGKPGRVKVEAGETVFCFHAGPYTADLIPFACAPEWGLRLRFVIDAANPRVSQQRFDLYLYSETSGRLTLAGFAHSIQAALQAELAQGALELPPCTSLDEWHAFRAGLNQLLYTRYGVTVDDCVPVDLGDTTDFAQVLMARAQHAAEAEARAVTDAGAMIEPSLDAVDRPPQPPRTAMFTAPATPDADALRRLFLELPALSAALRLLDLPQGLPVFEQHRALLLRLGMAALNVNTMPSLAWAAPDQPLAASEQQRRSGHTGTALAALDEGWSLLARLQLAGHEQWPPLLEEADRICANLETGLSLRRAAHAERLEPSL